MLLRNVSHLHLRPRGINTAYPPAAVAFGPAHPVARAAAARSLLGRQLAVTSGLLVLAAAAAPGHGTQVVTIASATLVVELGLACAFAMASSCLHERARDVVADGGGSLCVAEIAAERARLGSPEYREGLAADLECALHAAEHWHDLWVSTRPPPGVRNLLGCAEAARDVARLVRDAGSPVRGVALLDRLVSGGYASTLYAGRADDLSRELLRIRFLLTAGG